MHDLTIITTLAGGLAVALVFGWITQRLGLSTLVEGYRWTPLAVLGLVMVITGNVAVLRNSGR